MNTERMDIDGTLDLHMFQPAETKDLVIDYIDECLARGILELRIIHGKGIGVQREIVRSVLKGHPRVLDFNHPTDPGHWGVTVARLSPEEG
jgi:dsDNA-specific endonuclease/ATPase MutS2